MRAGIHDMYGIGGSRSAGLLPHSQSLIISSERRKDDALPTGLLPPRGGPSRR